MRDIDSFIAMVDYILNTPRKRHTIGGILLSASLLFVGLALTVITLKNDPDESKEEYEPSPIREQMRNDRTDYSDYGQQYDDDDSY